MNAKEQISRGSILLDLGAGECRYNFFFEHCNYLSADFGKGDAKWEYSKLDFMCDITRINFIKDGGVDFILNTTTLEHIAEPFRFFGEVKRVLKPGGKLFLYVPFVMCEHQVPYDFFRYTSYGLKYLCEKSGLKVVSILPSNKPLYTGIRWAYQVLGQTKCDSLFAKILLNGVKGVFKFFLIPLFDYLEVYSTTTNFPQCWLLVAEKEGQRHDVVYNNKQKAIESIIWCPNCKGGFVFSTNSYTCSKCRREYPIKGSTIIFL
ncbi:MAG: methyltransferase domain-containing protein [Thermoplasmata archaeon]